MLCTASAFRRDRLSVFPVSIYLGFILLIVLLKLNPLFSVFLVTVVVVGGFKYSLFVINTFALPFCITCELLNCVRLEIRWFTLVKGVAVGLRTGLSFPRKLLILLLLRVLSLIHI